MREKRPRWRGLAAMLRASAVVGALLIGCGPAVRGTGSQPTAPTDPAFAQAKAECTQRAVDATRDTHPQGVASKAAIGIYSECMREKGFPLGAREN